MNEKANAKTRLSFVGFAAQSKNQSAEGGEKWSVRKANSSFDHWMNRSAVGVSPRCEPRYRGFMFINKVDNRLLQ